MSFGQRRSLSGRVRSSLRVEPLEDRLMLAADCVEPVLDEPSDSLTAQAVVALDAGETFGTAAQLGEITEQQTLRGWTGGYWDELDIMQFSLTSDSDFSAQLSGLSADLDIYLFDDSGQLLDSSTLASTRSESIDITLDAGTFYVAVVPWRNAGSYYNLSLDATALNPPPTSVTPPVDDPPGDTPVDSPADPPPTTLPEVPYYGGSNDWNLNLISAPEAWEAGYTGEGVTVAVVDTGVDLDHPDLISNLWVNQGEIAGNGIDDDGNGYVDDISGWDFVSDDGRPDDGQGHGTHVAGTIAAGANGFGATGVAPDATIMPVRVLGNDGSGTSFDVAAGIRYAAENGADIINLSLGGGYSSSIRAAIEYAGQLGSIVIAAAGNSGASIPGYPAIFSASMNHVLSVGAHNSSERIASFSNGVGSSGAEQVDAPGVSVYSTYVGGRYANLSGTSMAAPHVAGLAALILDANPQLSAADVRSLIVDGADRTISGSDSLGGINAATSVAMALSTVGGQQSAAASSSVGGNDSQQGSRAASRSLGQFFLTDASSAEQATDSSGMIEQAVAQLVAASTISDEEPLTSEQDYDEAIDELFAAADSALQEIELSLGLPMDHEIAWAAFAG